MGAVKSPLLCKTEGFLGGSVVKNPPAKQEQGFHPWVEKIPWRQKWQPTPVFLPGKSLGQRSLVVTKESMGSQKSVARLSD